MEGIFRRRHLPHWDVAGKPVFVTACLHGSLSAAGLTRFRDYCDQLETRPCPNDLSQEEWKHQKHKLAFALVDQMLDHESPVEHLADDRQAEIVQDAFLHFAKERYALLAFVVMPSHHHWLFLPNENWSQGTLQNTSAKARQFRTPRQMISHSIQSYTATHCNRIRGQTGKYWQSETFDHWARDEAEMLRIVAYIENNPVKAGLVEHPKEWRWSSARIRAANGAAPGETIGRP
ncbi:MAG: hypothetical protein GXP24_04170 [Planctomycetes bacterium]|nr:hypothetical protein [Planctomycetota bacterium]